MQARRSLATGMGIVGGLKPRLTTLRGRQARTEPSASLGSLLTHVDSHEANAIFAAQAHRASGHGIPIQASRKNS